MHDFRKHLLHTSDVEMQSIYFLYTEAEQYEARLLRCLVHCCKSIVDIHYVKELKMTQPHIHLWFQSETTMFYDDRIFVIIVTHIFVTFSMTTVVHMYEKIFKRFETDSSKIWLAV